MRSPADAHRAVVATASAAVMGFLSAHAGAADPSRTRTTDGNEDTSYGRIQGDLAIVGGAGITVAPRGPRGTFDARVRYLETIGFFASYEDAALLGSGSDPARVFSAGLELRPLFLGRWLTGNETGLGRVDLMLDSIGVELGAVFAQPVGLSFTARPGAQAGLGFEIPLLAEATGPWIAFHGGLRWSDAALSYGTVDSALDREAFVSVTLAWHQIVLAHVVDVGDRPAR